MKSQAGIVSKRMKKDISTRKSLHTAVVTVLTAFAQFSPPGRDTNCVFRHADAVIWLLSASGIAFTWRNGPKLKEKLDQAAPRLLGMCGPKVSVPLPSCCPGVFFLSVFLPPVRSMCFVFYRSLSHLFSPFSPTAPLGNDQTDSYLTEVAVPSGLQT